MKKTTHTWSLLSCVSLVVGLSSSLLAQTPEQLEFFESRIRPVLVQHCYKCHSAEASKADKLKGGLLLDDREGMRRGGESGPAFVPGNNKQSLLLSALRHEDLEMPPKGKLPDPVIADFARWIKMGAPDPRDGKAVVATTIDLEKGRQFWSFQPVKKPAVPRTKDPAWSRSGIDQFIARQLKQEGLKPVDLATPESLVRRLYFDLVGLPPVPEELARWVEKLKGAKRDAALGDLVDSLLESPGYGERWGRHWLDVARYAESNGNSRNALFPHAWRYRDYVIDAFNADTPYNDFLVEQVAGDLLSHDGVEQHNKHLVATGFLALASKPVIKGRSGGFIPDVAADQIGVTSRAILGLTVACARCHDHKFDPIPTTDYYGLAGIFASSQTLYGGGGNNMGGAPATGLHVLVEDDPAAMKAYEQWKSQVAQLNRRIKTINDDIKKLRPKRVKGKPAPKLTEEQKMQLAKLNRQRQQLVAQLKKLQASAVDPPGSAMGIRESGKIVEVPVYIRGETAKGDAVSRRLISVIAGENGELFSSGQSGRLELANWLASDDNPLTSRVMVNRLWQHLFGTGLVRTPDNFGVNGERPTHPELLDYLAAEFVEDGWSIKSMIRRLVMTRAYQSSGDFDDRNYEIDPDNVYLWRYSRRRLEAEPIRDAILAVSGTLKEDRPEGSVVSSHGNQLIQDALTPDKIHQPSNHRSIYLPILRNGLPEVLSVFDLADPSLVVGHRTVTTVPSQDLFMMNSPFVVEKSREFAQRLLMTSDDEKERVTFAFQLALSRLPTSTEIAEALQFIRESGESLAEEGANEELELRSWSGFCQALFVSNEFRHVQ